MTHPQLSGGAAAADRLVADVLAQQPSRRALWQVSGAASAGKTTLLHMAAQRIAAQGLVPVLMAPPARETDTGPAALVELGVGLKARQVIDGKLDVLTDPRRSWADKLAEVQRWLDENRQQVVLLCDEPHAWPSGAGEDAHFAARALDVATMVLQATACRRIVAGPVPAAIEVRDRIVLERESVSLDWLHDRAAWGALADAARALAGVETLWGRVDAQGRLLPESAAPSGYTPLEVRLLVAHVALSSVEEVEKWLTTRHSRREIAHRLADRIMGGDRDGRYVRLREVWARLSLVRRPFRPELLDELGAAGLDPLSRSILEHGLLFERDGCFVLHDMLRTDARAFLRIDAPALRDAHRRLTGYYAAQFRAAAARVDPAALVDEMEALHHATAAGDAALADRFRPFFVEQLDALGRTLSRDLRDRAGAVKVFERSIEWDGSDDYAHHYLAFNLDIEGSEPARVETHYQRAIALDPDNVWWRARWVSYLLVRGRSGPARAAWDDALDALGLPDPNADASIYENLHIWVARLLIHRGQLDFADDVLRGIPATVREAHPGLRALARRLDALVEARRSRAVFPLWVPPDRWWQGPHLSARRMGESSALERWLPGRIDAMDEDAVHVVVAEPPDEAGGPPRLGAMAFAPADFDRWSRDQPAAELRTGRFVELAYYGPDSTLVIRVHPDHEWEDRDLPPLFPDPVRYLRRSGWVR